MKIVHAAGWYLPESIGGTEVYVAAVVRRLRLAGVNVRVAAPSAGAHHANTYEHEGTAVFRYPIPRQPTRAEARAEQPVRGAEIFHEWLKTERPDIVHLHTFVTGLDWFEVRAARAAGARVFVTSHSSALGYVCLRGTLLRWGTHPCDGVIDERECAACTLHHRGVPHAVARAVAALPRPVAALADRVDSPVGTAVGLPAYIDRRKRRQRDLFDDVDGFYVLTSAARDILLANGAPAHKVQVNRLGIDEDVIGASQRAGSVRRSAAPVTIGFLGRFDPIKGVEDLLRAARSIDSSIPFRLVFRGIGDDDAAIRLRAACEGAAKVDARIAVEPQVERAHIAEVLARWDVLCCPGLTLEGGPTVALEAMAVGTPVIGTRFGGLAEVISDHVNGRLIEAGDWRALAKIIREVADRPSLVDAWRVRLPAVRSMADVTADYLSAYRGSLS